MVEIEIEFETLNQLYKSYMSFINEGGLFVVTDQIHPIGKAVKLNVKLPQQLDFVTVMGRVSWLSPASSHNNTPKGIGISFVKDDAALHNQIETLLGGMVNSNEPTYTM